jgi:DNA-binding MarR family transcriptional regulator
MPFMRTLWLEMKDVLRSARQFINAELAPLNLSGAEGDILFHLLTGSNHFRQEQLAQQLDIGKAAISRAVDSLESKGYVVRVRLEEDKRALSVSLAEKAISAGSTVTGIYERLYTLVKQGIADEEIAQIESLLARVAKNLQSLEEKNVP